jgi:hypothetical protein
MALEYEDPLADQPKIPISGRPVGDPRKIDGKKGDENNHGAILNGGQPIHDQAKDKAGKVAAKKADVPTMGSQMFDMSKNPVDFIKKFDPKNLAGSIPFALNLSKIVQAGLDPQAFIKDLLGSKITEMMGQLSQVTNLLQQAQNLLPAQVQQLMQLEQQLVGKLNEEIGALTEKVTQVTDVAKQINDISNNVKSVTEQPNKKV